MLVLGMTATLVRAQEPGVPSTVETMSADRALQEAISLVRRLAEGDEEGGWEDVSARMDRYLAIIEADNPSSPWLFYLYGWVYTIGGQKGDAIEQFEKFTATREGRNEWLAYRMLGDLLVDQFPRLAKANYAKAGALVDREPSVLHGLSRCAVATGDLTEAIRLAREAVDADRSARVRYLSHLARTLARERRWGEAQRAAETALERALSDRRKDPSSDRPLKLADLQYQILLDIARGRINETPSPEGYVRIVDYIERRAEIANQLHRFEIVRLLEVAIREPGGDSYAPLHERYVVALATLDRTEEAVRAIERLLRFDPSNPTAREWLARLRPEALPEPEFDHADDTPITP